MASIAQIKIGGIKLTKSIVIVISGVTAGGKTTLINELHKEFIDSKVISFDNYSIDAFPSAPPIETPVQEAVNQYDLSPLMKDFLSAKDTFSFIFIDFPYQNLAKIFYALFQQLDLQILGVQRPLIDSLQ